MAVVILACGWAWRVQREEPAAAANPATIGRLHPRIASVSMDTQEKETLVIVLDQDTALYEASAVTDMARTALVISEGLKTYFSDAQAERVRFVGRWPVLGLERFVVNTRMLELSFSWEDLLAADFDESFTYQQFLNQAKAVGYLTPRDRKLVTGFCEDPSARTAGPFCRQALGAGPSMRL